MLRLALLILLILSVAISNAQFNSYRIKDTYYPDQRSNYFFPAGAYNYDAQQNFGRSPAFDAAEQLGQARTITLFLANPVTTFSTSTVYTTCTMSIAAASSCVESGSRRRRGIPPTKMLFDENDEESKILPLSPRGEETPTAAEPLQVQNVQLPAVPYFIQPGFNVPEGGTGRLLLAIGTSTVRATSFFTSTIKLQPVCASTTDYSAC